MFVEHDMNYNMTSKEYIVYIKDLVAEGSA
jgi:hypothetical protein